MKKLATSWEQVAAMRKESVTLRAQVATSTRVQARGVVRTTAVGPITTTTVANHHPPYVATTSRRMIRREYPIFTPICAVLCLCLISNLSFFLSPSCLINNSNFSLFFLSIFVLLLVFFKAYMIFELFKEL
jgi:hypothetical protein